MVGLHVAHRDVAVVLGQHLRRAFVVGAGTSDLQKLISSWDRMNESALKAATKAQVAKLNKMLRRYPWEPDMGVGYTSVELLTELELCKKVEEKLEKLIVERWVRFHMLYTRIAECRQTG